MSNPFGFRPKCITISPGLCDSCGGDGVRECDLGHDHDCSACDGTGDDPSKLLLCQGCILCEEGAYLLPEFEKLFQRELERQPSVKDSRVQRWIAINIHAMCGPWIENDREDLRKLGLFVAFAQNLEPPQGTRVVRCDPVLTQIGQKLYVYRLELIQFTDDMVSKMLYGDVGISAKKPEPPDYHGSGYFEAKRLNQLLQGTQAQ
jgi:hypothetical protein